MEGSASSSRGWTEPPTMKSLQRNIHGILQVNVAIYSIVKIIKYEMEIVRPRGRVIHIICGFCNVHILGDTVDSKCLFKFAQRCIIQPASA